MASTWEFSKGTKIMEEMGPPEKEINGGGIYQAMTSFRSAHRISAITDI